MLDHIIKLSLKNRFLILAFLFFIFVTGALSLNQLSVDVFPDLTKPTVTLVTEAQGRAPEEVEALVTIPLEFGLAGLPQMQRIRSTSGIGISVIYLEFEWGTDIYLARQGVTERLALLRESLPQDVVPVMGPVSSIMGQIQQIAVHSPSQSVSAMDLRSYAEWVLRPALLRVPGVAQVLSLGGELKQYQILISSERLNHYQINLEDLDHNLSKISRNTSGGFIEVGDQEFLVRNMGAVSDVEGIKNTIIGQHLGRPVYVKDIAEVKVAGQLKRGDASYMARPSVVLVIQKQPGANTVQISKDIDRLTEELKAALSEDIVIETEVFRQADFIEKSIAGVTSKLKSGVVLVFIVLLVFLANLRMSVITLMAIPLSFFMTFIVFKLWGLTINTMTLGGLAIAIGELVDDSIVDVENIFRRLKENARLQSPKSYLRVIYEASAEVRNSIVMATLIVTLMFMPLFQLDGLEGRLFTPLAISYLTALFSSLLISLTVTPVLCSFLLKNVTTEKPDTLLVRILKQVDSQILSHLLGYPKIIISIVGGIFIVSLGVFLNFGSDFLPQFNEGTAMVSVVAPPGTSLSRSNELGAWAETEILKIESVQSVSRRTGRSERDEHAMGVHVSEIDVTFKKDSQKDREQVLTDIREALEAIPDVSINVGQPIAHLMDHALSGVSAQVAIKIFGEDLDLLRLKAAELKEIIEDVKGLVDLSVEQQALIPQLKVYVLPEEAARYHLSAGEVTDLLEPAFNSATVGTLLEGQRFYDLIYRFDDESKAHQKGIEQTRIKTMPNGRTVLVSDVADVYQTQGPNEIQREDSQRRIVISANVAQRDLGTTVQEIQRFVSQNLELPEGYFVTYGGQFTAQQNAQKKILLFGALVLLGALALLWVHFQSLTLVLQIMVTIPFAFIGGVWALYLAQESLTVASLIGFITLSGIAARNTILMISHYLHLLEHEGEEFTASMIIRGSLERLVPVLMTASVTTLALLPIAFSAAQPGSEVLYPVALVIVGGLISSTILDVLVTPVLFFNYARQAAFQSLQKKARQVDL